MSEAHAPVAVHHGHEAAHDHGPVQHQFDDFAQQRDSNSLGMWMFLSTEIMMFGGLFFAYSFYRWKFQGAFHEGSHHLDTNLGTLNTFVLLFSSWTMALAVHGAATKNKGKLVTFLSLTWLLGFSFIVIKAFEWTKDWREGLVPGLHWNFYLEHALPAGISQHEVMMYFVIYFCMAGLHAIHMIVGLGCVFWFIVLAAKGQFTTNENDQPVEIMGLYWHLIDIIWVFLFPLLYLIAGWHPFGGGH